MKKLQMIKKSANPVLLAVICIFAMGWFHQAETQTVKYPYEPLITKISPFPKGEVSAWIEFHNPLATFVNASDLLIVINDEYKFAFPERLPPVPPKGFIILKLDGKADPEILEYRHGSVELHTPWDLTGVMKGKPGQIAVYQKVKVADNKFKLAGFLSWGAPGSAKSQTPERNRIWKPNWFVEMGQGSGDYNPGALKKADYVIGLYPGSSNAGLTDWVIYARDEVKPGILNVVPPPAFFIPHDGAVVHGEEVTIRWLANKHARAFRFQMAKDPDFRSIIVDKMLKSPIFQPVRHLKEGTYYYRASVVDFAKRESVFSQMRTLRIKLMDRLRPIPSEKILGAVHVLQRKDTHLLCLDGCPSDQNSSAALHWDAEHTPANPFSIMMNPDHGLANCVRASIAMMASIYGKTLSQDRIAYYTEEESPAKGNAQPEGDLAHFVGMNFNQINGGADTVALEWALGQPPIYMLNNPTFNQVRNWLIANRPIMTRTPVMPLLGLAHVRVLDGYKIDNGGVKWVRILDPLITTPQWEEFQSWNSSAVGTWVGPSSAPNARGKEAGIEMDSDNDGIMDFDEVSRFHTNPNKKDTDGDGIEDKDEIRSYVFNSANDYAYGDPDGNKNGVRKELDPNE